MNENAKWKLTKGIAYLFFSIIFWFFPISFLYMLSVAGSEGRFPIMGDPTGITQLLLMTSAIIAIVLLALGIQNIATMKTPTKKEKVKLKEINKDEKIKQLEKRLDKIEKDETKSEDNPENS